MDVSEPLKLTTIPWVNGRDQGGNGFTKVGGLFLDGRSMADVFPYGSATWCDARQVWRHEDGGKIFTALAKPSRAARFVLTGGVPIEREGLDPSDPRRLAVTQLQVGIVGTIVSQVLPWDIDTFDEGVLASELAQTVVREIFGLHGELSEDTVRAHLQRLLGSSRKGKSRGHIFFDWRRYATPETWPTQGRYLGTDFKANGFVAAPGCLHHTGEVYEPHTGELPPRSRYVALEGTDVQVLVVTPTPAIVKAFCEASPPRRQAVSLDLSVGGRHADVLAGATDEEILEAVGDNHDDYLTSWAMRHVLRGESDADILAGMERIVEVIRSYGPCNGHQLPSKIRSARRKYEQHLAAEQARLKAEEEAEEQTRQEIQERLRAQRLRALARANEVRAQARRDAERRQVFMVNPMNTAIRDTSSTCVPHVDHEGGSQLASGHGSIVTDLGKIAKIHQYERDLRSADWAQQAPERLLALDILVKLKDGETVHASDAWLAERRETLESLLKNHSALLGLTQDGRVVALEGDGDQDDYVWRCTGCRNTHRLSHWPSLPPAIALAHGCPLGTGIDVAHDRDGQKRLVAMYVRLKQELADKARAEGREPNRLKDGLTGRKVADAWNGGERGEYACLSINKVNKLLRTLSYEKVLLIRLRKPRNYLRNHRCRTASAVYGLPSECPELTSSDPEVRAEAERWLGVEDDLEWMRFWARRDRALTEARELRAAVAS